MATPEEYEWDVFISHNHKSKPWLRELVDQWRKLDLRVFFDEDCIDPGEHLASGIERGINRSRHVVLVITPAAVKSNWVALETAAAILSDPGSTRRRLIPVVLESTDVSEISILVKSRRMVDLTSQDTRRFEYQNLLRFLGVQRSPLPEPPFWTTQHTDEATFFELVIDRDFETYSEHDQARLFNAIKDLLRIGDLKVVHVDRGSVRVTLQLTPEQAYRLSQAVECGELRAHSVRTSSILGSSSTGGPSTADSAGVLANVVAETERQDSLLDDRYDLLEMVGHGSFAVVHRAKDRKLQRFVAVKLLREKFFKKSLIALFTREARLLAGIAHANIVNVYDTNVSDGTPYIVMEYVEGRSLSSVLAENGPLPVGQVQKLARQLCSAVQAAHDAEIIHRDLKSENLMLVSKGHEFQLKVLDFGVARMITEAHLSVTIGRPIGSPLFMSPEQFGGSEVTRLSDVYAIGVILFEMLTGMVPFTGETFDEIEDKHRNSKPPNPAKLNPSISEATAQVVLQALNKLPSRRHSSAWALWKAFEESLAES